MLLVANQPISPLLSTLDPSVVMPYVQDNSFSADRERFYPKFSSTQQMYIQWTLDGTNAPAAAVDIQIYDALTNVLAKNMGTWTDQTTNKNWFTLKFKWFQLGLPNGCYYIRWKERPNDVSNIFQSNTFFITDQLNACKLVTATCDCNGFGFDWTVFALSWYIPFGRFNFEYDLIFKNYLESDQTNNKYYAERGKFWQCRTLAMDESAHDSLSLMLLCSRFLVDGIEYYIEKKEYSLPDLDADGKVDQSVAEFQLHRQRNQPVNTNCKDCNNEIYPYYG